MKSRETSREKKTLEARWFWPTFEEHREQEEDEGCEDICEDDDWFWQSHQQLETLDQIAAEDGAGQGKQPTAAEVRQWMIEQGYISVRKTKNGQWMRFHPPKFSGDGGALEKFCMDGRA
jgi:hypothetical protein